MKRVNIYIDGYNFYHATKKKPSAKINFKALAESLIEDNQILNDIYYFSAFATWKPDDFIKHKKYVKLLEKVGVKIIMSHFKKKPVKCKNCNSFWNTHEKKETDVQIALQMLSDSYEDVFDRAFIISSDGDLVPPIKRIKEKFSEKEIIAVIHESRQKKSRDIMANSDSNLILTIKKIEKYLF